MSRGSGLDGLLSYMGAPHPCVVLHLLITLGMFVLGLGSLETSMLLPVPLYSCWGGLDNTDLARTCQVAKIFPHTPLNEVRRVFECSDSKWQPYHWVGAVMVGMRTLVTIFAGIGADTFGRRRSAIVWLGLYFVVSFARSFAPNMDTVVFCVTLEAAAAQAVTISLLLIASEGSTQKECVRSVCLVFIGHAIGVGAGAPLINHYVPTETYRQIARSLPSLVFVLFIFGLPESGRWLVCRGQLQKATVALKKSHHIVFDPVVRPKLTTLYEEHRCSVSAHGCAGSSYSEAVSPIFCTGIMVRISFTFILMGLAVGSAVSARANMDNNPYGSHSDRAVAYGVVETLALLLLGLAIARLPVRRVFLTLMFALSCAILLTPLLDRLHVSSCGGEVFFSCLGHFVVVLVVVWLAVSTVRMSPTHSRGTLIGLTFAASTLGSGLAQLDLEGAMKNWGYKGDRYLTVGVWSLVSAVGGMLCLILPRMPKYLPETMVHLYPKTPDWVVDKDGSGELGLLQCRSTASDYDSSDDEDFARDVHKHINKYRKKHAVPKIKLSKEVCQYAKEWAIKMAKEDKMQMRPDCIYGTNVFCMSANSQTFKIEGKNIVDRWYGEIKDHTFGEEPEENILKSGHFSQLIWKDTKMIGIAKARSDTGFKIYVAAHFAPKGNWSGQFTKQVPPIGGFPKGSKGRTSIFSKMRNVSVNSIDVSSDEEDLIDDCIKSHNEYRKKHRVRPLKKNKELNRFAKEWAIICARRDTMEHRPNNQYGENIYRSWSSTPGHKIKGNVPVESWYEEISDFIFGEEPTDTRAGHFTQLVWEDSREVGVGVARSQSGWLYVVANYKPAGNYVGSFATKVHKPK